MQVVIDFVFGHDYSLFGVTLRAVTHNGVCLIFFLILEVKLPVLDIRIHPQNNKFSMGVDKKATGESKLDDSPDWGSLLSDSLFWCSIKMDNFRISERALLYVLYRLTVSLYGD